MLKPLKNLLPEGVLSENVASAAVSSTKQLDRKNLRLASKLLDEAGWEVGDDGLRKNNKGETVKVNARFVWRYRYTDAGGKRRTVTIGDYDAFPAPKEAAGVANSWKYKEVDPLEEKKKKTGLVIHPVFLLQIVTF